MKSGEVAPVLRLQVDGFKLHKGCSGLVLGLDNGYVKGRVLKIILKQPPPKKKKKKKMIITIIIYIKKTRIKNRKYITHTVKKKHLRPCFMHLKIECSVMLFVNFGFFKLFFYIFCLVCSSKYKTKYETLFFLNFCLGCTVKS